MAKRKKRTSKKTSKKKSEPKPQEPTPETQDQAEPEQTDGVPEPEEPPSDSSSNEDDFPPGDRVYPCLKYHKDHGVAKVHSRDEEELLGVEWSDDYSVMGEDPSTKNTKLMKSRPAAYMISKIEGERKKD